MAKLENYIWASNDDLFKRIQKIALFNYQGLVDEPEIVDKFLTLCSENLTFVDTWDNSKITPSTMRLHIENTSKEKFSKFCC